jgi:hypothetical protein
VALAPPEAEAEPPPAEAPAAPAAQDAPAQAPPRSVEWVDDPGPPPDAVPVGYTGEEDAGDGGGDAAAPQPEAGTGWPDRLLTDPAWAGAPACRRRPNVEAATADEHGRLWGFEGLRSCAFKGAGGVPLGVDPPAAAAAMKPAAARAGGAAAEASPGPAGAQLQPAPGPARRM